ncbi:MAG: hypothetical protein EA362_02845, partial [Saprospirales bacterium]
MAFGMQQINAQCFASFSFGSGNAPVVENQPVTLTTCAFVNEYSTVFNAQAGSLYQFAATGSGPVYITITQGTSTGTVLGHGFSPVQVVPTATGNLYMHYHANAACALTSLGCIAGSITLLPSGSACQYDIPADIIVNNDLGQCGANVSFTVGQGTCQDPPMPIPPSGSFFPVGTTEVSVGSGVSFASFNVTVIDAEAPVLNCPADIFVTLNPGECSRIINYTVTATDNCPFTGDLMFHFQDPLLNSGWYGFANNLENLSTDPMMISSIRVRASATPFGFYNFQVYMRLGTYQDPGVLNSPAGWTLVADEDYNVTGAFVTGGGSDVDIIFNEDFVIPPGETAAIYYVVDNGATLNRRIMYNGGVLESNDGNIRIFDGAGTNLGVFTGIQFQPRAAYLGVNYQLGGDAEIVQTSGLPSGSVFPAGITTNCFEVEDVAGNVGECCFDVVVNDFPNPTRVLVCNNHVNISVDQNCEALLNADMILEGGPYSCYDDYELIIETLGGVIVSNPITAPFVGQTLMVTVLDPATGNSCWGNVKVEDKIPPVIVCRDLVLSCNDDLPTEPAPGVFDPADLEQPAPFNNFWTGYAFNLDNEGFAPIQIEGMEVQAALAGSAAGTYNIRIFMRNGTFEGFTNNAAGWVEVGNEDVQISAGFPTISLYEVFFNNPFLIGAGETAGVAVYVNNGNGFGVRVCGELGTAPTTDGILTINNNPARWLVPVGANG